MSALQQEYLVVPIWWRNINPVNLGWKHFTITKQNHPNIRTYHLMHYVNSGSGYVEMNGKIEKVKKGDIFMISPGVEANWWRDSDDPEPWIYSWISFEATVSIDFLDFQILRQPNHRICHAFESVKKQSYEKSFDAGDFSTIYKILYEISQGVNSPPNQSMTTRIIYAKTYLDTHFTENISIQQVADSLYVNRRYLTKKFTSTYGCSPQQYLMNLRLDFADKLLKQGHSVTYAAIMSGCSNPSNFSGQYKQRFGRSPFSTKRQGE